MKVLYAAAEIAPFVRMTTTADLLRFLPASLQDKGFEIRILLPKFGTINDRRNRLHEVIRLSGISVEIGNDVESMRIKVASIPNAKLQVYFLDNDRYFSRKALFLHPETGEHYEDDDQRIVFYNKGVLETVMELGWQPDIIHCHDWPAGMIPFLVKKVYRGRDDGFFDKSRIIYNIHHTENHGIFDSSILDLLDLPDSLDTDDIIENGKIDLRRLGLQFSDHVVTGNRLTNQLDDLFEEMNIKPTKIQGSPERVSDKFARYYNEIASSDQKESSR